MKLAVISDIHSNIIALELAINNAIENGINQFAFLGDYITDGNKNNEVLDLIKKYSTNVVAGNRERYISNYNQENKNFSNYKTIANTYEELTKENIEYLKSLEYKKIIEINNYKILLIHGDSYDVSKENLEFMFQKLIELYDFDICLFGHSHRYLNKYYKGKYFVNPGSIGGPTDTPTYKYIILDLENEVKVKLVEFEVKDTYAKLEKQYKMSKYYKENYIWCDLILEGIKDGKDYCTPFIELFNINAKSINKSNYIEFNNCWEKTYKVFKNTI